VQDSAKVKLLFVFYEKIIYIVGKKITRAIAET